MAVCKITNIAPMCAYNLEGIDSILLLDTDDFVGFRFEDDDLYNACIVEEVIRTGDFVSIPVSSSAKYSSTEQANVYSHSMETFLEGLSGAVMRKLFLASKRRRYIVFFQTKDGKYFTFGYDSGASVTFSAQTAEAVGTMLTIGGASSYPLFEVTTEAMTVDAPVVLTRVVYNGNPSQLVLLINRDLDPAYPAAVGAFTVPGHAVTSIIMDGNLVRLNLAPPVVNGEDLTVSYDQDNAAPMRDMDGNLLASFSAAWVMNMVLSDEDPTPPEILTATINNSNKFRVILYFDRALKPGFTGDAAAFTISPSKTLSSKTVGGAGNRYIYLDYTTAFTPGVEYDLDYAPVSNGVRDLFDVLLPDFVDLPIDNNVTDTTPPVFISRVIYNGNHYRISAQSSKPLNPAYIPATSAFELDADEDHILSDITIDGLNVHFDFLLPFAFAEDVKLKYTMPGVDGFRDFSGNALASFGFTTVLNYILDDGEPPVPPEILTVTVSNSNPARIVVYWDRSLNPAFLGNVGAFTIDPARTITSRNIGGTGNRYLYLYVSPSFAEGEEATLSYNPTSNGIRDLDDVEAVPFDDSPIDNNVTGGGGEPGDSDFTDPEDYFEGGPDEPEPDTDGFTESNDFFD